MVWLIFPIAPAVVTTLDACTWLDLGRGFRRLLCPLHLLPIQQQFPGRRAVVRSLAVRMRFPQISRHVDRFYYDFLSLFARAFACPPCLQIAHCMHG